MTKLEQDLRLYIGKLHQMYFAATVEKLKLQAEVRRLKSLLREKGSSHVDTN